MTIIVQWLTALCWLLACIMAVLLIYASIAPVEPDSCYAPKLHPQIQWDPKTWGRGLA
jgi:hypothetical protein